MFEILGQIVESESQTSDQRKKRIYARKCPTKYIKLILKLHQTQTVTHFDHQRNSDNFRWQKDVYTHLTTSGSRE